MIKVIIDRYNMKIKYRVDGASYNMKIKHRVDGASLRRKSSWDVRVRERQAGGAVWEEAPRRRCMRPLGSGCAWS